MNIPIATTYKGSNKNQSIYQSIQNKEANSISVDKGIKLSILEIENKFNIAILFKIPTQNEILNNLMNIESIYSSLSAEVLSNLNENISYPISDILFEENNMVFSGSLYEIQESKKDIYSIKYTKDIDKAVLFFTERAILSLDKADMHLNNQLQEMAERSQSNTDMHKRVSEYQQQLSYQLLELKNGDLKDKIKKVLLNNYNEIENILLKTSFPDLETTFKQYSLLINEKAIYENKKLFLLKPISTRYEIIYVKGQVRLLVVNNEYEDKKIIEYNEYNIIFYYEEIIENSFVSYSNNLNNNSLLFKSKEDATKYKNDFLKIQIESF